MEFQTFEDKSSAINQNTGVSERLADMIRAWLPGKKMAVGKPEYKEIIEERLVSISSCFTYTFEQL
jgi:nucleolar protein 58